ncbi:MAG: ABC transporter ATP-binding protein [Bacilli bacterium]|nr:ABC transporter ATP-binding protein [Bacilli bacterium]MDY0063588.1 ABC transporter ATP-binding protein [Bacilli bacterium]
MVKGFIKYYRPHLKLFILDIFCALSIAGIDLVFPLVTNRVLNQYLNDLKMVLLFGGILLGLYLLKFLFGYIVGYYGHMMGIRLETDMRKDLYKKFQQLDYQFFDDKKTGELMTHLTTYLHDVSEMSHHAPEDLFISTIMLIGSFIILLQTNIYLTLIIFVFLSMLVTYSISRRKKMMKGFRAARTAQGELNSITESSLSGIRLTKAFNNENYEIEKFQEINHLYYQARTLTFRELGLYSTGNEFFMNLANVGLLVFGSIFIFYNKIDIIDLTTYFLYINFLTRPISRLTNSMEQIQQGFSGIEKFYQIMKINPQIISKIDAVKKDAFHGKIDFKDVHFQYEQSEATHVLKNFNLSIEPGKKIALVGETGVGKTTISKLIPRFYDVNEGQILVDNIDVKEYDLDNLRSAIGHVQQDVFIFFGSIKDNIMYGKLDATDEEIIAAAKKARIHDFIMEQEQTYQTMVGERGIKLSGGQKQRIAIARLFLKNPKILILDEATSSLDNITEKLIQESLEELSKNKTTITIAHRLSTVKNADEIIVLGANGIKERGTHQELIAKNGYYSELYQTSIAI